MKFTFHEEILDLGSMWLDLTNEVKDPRELALMDSEWIHELFEWRKGERFEEDKPKRIAAGMG